MTIILARDVRVGGVVLASGTTQTLGADLEADLVSSGSATPSGLAPGVSLPYANHLEQHTAIGLDAALAGKATLAGTAGGQTLQGGTASAETLTLKSTAHATKGKIIIGSLSAYDESNAFLGIGTTSPSAQLTQQSTAALESAPLGAELLDATSWTATSGWSGDFNAGFVHAAAGGTTTLSRTTVTSLASLYQISFNVTGRTAGNFTITVGTEVSNRNWTTSGSHSTKILSANQPLIFTPTTDFDGTISAISLKPITGITSPVYRLNDNTGTSIFEIRASPNTMYNMFLGKYSGRQCTTGINNTSVGTYANQNVTTGYNNVAIGYNSQSNLTSGNSNSAIGLNAQLAITTGGYNVALGAYSQISVVTGGYNTSIGTSSLYSITTGSNNIGVGYTAGRFLADGSTPNQTTNSSVYVGYDTRASADGVTNENVFGHTAVGIGSNSVVIGNSSVTKSKLNGDIQLDKTVTAGGTTGAQTISKTVGSVNFAVAATSLVVTNTRVATTSIIVATVASNDATMKSVQVVAAAGSFTIYANAAATAETRVNFIVIN